MRSLAPALLACAALGCATSAPHGLLRVDLPGPQAGPGSPGEQALAAAVRDAAASEGLVCQPGPGGSLLHCSAGSVGTQSRALTVDLSRSGTGYGVAVEQVWSLPGRASPVCEVQDRLQDRIAAALSPPAVRVDGRSECKGK